MSDSPDANLQLKKRARRRLVGAIAFAGLAAVVLPMIMDEEPKQQLRDVRIRIPGQDQTPFNPKVERRPATPDPDARAVAPPRIESDPQLPTEIKKAEKTIEKAPEKSEKPEKTSKKESQSAGDKSADDPVAAAIANSAGGQHVILIGAYSNPANVKQLQTKIGELGIKVFTEPLELPDGKKTTRVRAGPFPNREAADKALEKLKRIGVNGVIAAKQ